MSLFRNKDFIESIAHPLISTWSVAASCYSVECWEVYDKDGSSSERLWKY